MKIWVDADACPNVIKDILFKAADKRKIHTIFVANQFIRTPPSPFLSSVQVGAGFDVADNQIVKDMAAGDLVITADIPLAAEVVEKQGWALNPRGEFYTKENIQQRLTMRNFMEEMRSTGQVSGGPPPLNLKDRQAFANELDKFISQNGGR
ncbi:MAG: YaiI/YqxD family protein [Algicola sp.]|nr:YaiI/YqxD family protein [Algicola sp.]